MSITANVHATYSAWTKWLLVSSRPGTAFARTMEHIHPSTLFPSVRTGSGPLPDRQCSLRCSYCPQSRDYRCVLLKNANRNARVGAGSKMLPLSNTGAGVKTVAVIRQDANMPKDECKLNECNEGVMVIGYEFFTSQSYDRGTDSDDEIDGVQDRTASNMLYRQGYFVRRNGNLVPVRRPYHWPECG